MLLEDQAIWLPLEKLVEVNRRCSHLSNHQFSIELNGKSKGLASGAKIASVLSTLNFQEGDVCSVIDLSDNGAECFRASYSNSTFISTIRPPQVMSEEEEEEEEEEEASSPCRNAAYIVLGG